MTSIASHIIQRLGGASAVSAHLGLNISTVCRWTYPREVGGSAGLIPSRWHHPLLEMAHEKGIDLSPSDFFYAPSPETVAQSCAERKSHSQTAN